MLLNKKDSIDLIIEWHKKQLNPISVVYDSGQGCYTFHIETGQGLSKVWSSYYLYNRDIDAMLEKASVKAETLKPYMKKGVLL